MTAKSTADLNTEADTNLADNTSGDISAADVRTMVKNLADSAANLTDLDATPLTVARGGSGAATLTDHGVLVGSGTGAITPLSVGATGSLLQGTSGSDPAFTATPILGIAGTTAGTLRLSGVTSGVVTIKTADAAGTWALTLPANDGDSGQVLQTDGSGVASWATVSASPGGSDTQIQFNDSSAFGGDADLVYNKTTNLLSAINAGIGATSTASLLLTNTTAAAAGAQQWSPAIQLTGQGWKTAATAASQTVDWRIENIPVQGSSAPTTVLSFSPQVNAGGFAGGFQIGSSSATPWTVNSTADELRTAATTSTSGIRLGTNSGNTWLGGTGTTARLGLNVNGTIGWASDGNPYTGTIDLIIKRRGAASLQLGATDAAAPVAQTLGVQSVVAGTSNTAGAAFTIAGSISTGTGIGGSVIFQTTSAAASASTQNALANVLELSGNKNVVVGNAALATDAADGFLYIPTCAGTPTGTPTAYTGRVPIVFDTTNNKLYIYDGSWLGGTSPGAFT